MRRILHILTRPDAPLAGEIIKLQSTNPRNVVDVTDMTRPAPDYKNLLEKIFAADSVETW